MAFGLYCRGMRSPNLVEFRLLLFFFYARRMLRISSTLSKAAIDAKFLVKFFARYAILVTCVKIIVVQEGFQKHDLGEVACKAWQ